MAAISNYLSILPLSEVQTFLRIDSDFSGELSQELTVMINAAFELLEKETNHIFIPGDKTYLFQDYENYCLNIYDFPIRAVVSPNEDQLTIKKRPLYTQYQGSSNDDELVLTVGYEDTDDVPQAFKQAALQQIKNWYYAKDENSKVMNFLSNEALAIVANYKRFIL